MAPFTSKQDFIRQKTG